MINVMTRQADWYIDVLSPYPYLQLALFDQFPADLVVRAKPVLFAGLLGHWGSKGPAEIPAKRSQTYRYCHWLAAKRGITFKVPPRHPFNPLALLRMTIALGSELEVVRAVFEHVWGAGRDGEDPAVLSKLADQLGLSNWQQRIGDPAVKHQLKANTEEAIGRGVFGVPSFVVDGEVFWGEDSTPMMLDFLEDPALFSRGEMARLADLPIATQRKESRL
ncbi:MAG: 2-hydroxychromene-2-carboxylate isomerase [Hyphomicrobiaceae bacterium]|jgi:2-hydroxychromene-2-carboxylate isomerase